MTNSTTARSLAPDLARGALLLFIAIANSPWYLWGDTTTRDMSAWPVEASELDRIVQTISLIAIDGRSYPMFAALFGYGIWQLYSRQLAAGTSPKDARRLLQKRHAWMLAFGFVHAALLWAGDIVGAYGLVGLIVVWVFLDRKDRTLVVWSSILTLALVSIAATSAVGAAVFAALGKDVAGGGFGVGLGIDNPNYLASLVDRVVTWTLLTPGTAFVSLVVPTAILVAIVAARHRVLEDPAAHLRLLRWSAVLGIAIGWAGGALTAAQNADVLGIPASLDWAFAPLHSVTGLACGLGYVALFGLIAARIREPGPIATAVRAVGARSLTFYLAQSVLFAPVMSAWGLGLGAELSSWSIVLYAIGVWVLTVIVAAVLERRGVQGPAEWALRRLYRAKRSTTQP